MALTESTTTSTRKKSAEIYQKSAKLIPGGVNSPVRSFKEIGISPMIVKRGKGDTIWDVDGNAYVDFCMSWGPLILGHVPDKIAIAGCERIMQGSTFGIATEEEMKLAEAITNAMPSMQKIRFVSSGTEATMSALRLARGYTGKEYIVKFSGNYHGHHDSLLVQAGSGVTLLPQSSSGGVPESVVKNTICLRYNDTEAVLELFRKSPHKDKIAAVILEPIAANMGVIPAKDAFLQTLREETKRTNTVLIFDEVISGFRVGWQGAQGMYGITPDLTCLGKIIGGGFPAAAFGGKAEIMDCLAPLGPVYQAGTLSGNPVAMVSGLLTLQEISKKGFYEDLLEKTNLIVQGVKAALRQKRSKNSVVQVGSLFTIYFGVDNPSSKEDLSSLNTELFRKLFIFLFENGVYIPPSNYEAWFVSSAHTKENLLKTRDLILTFINQNVF